MTSDEFKRECKKKNICPIHMIPLKENMFGTKYCPKCEAANTLTTG